MSKIEWTGKTWNPATGCTKVSPGCKHCYAERMAMRLKENRVPFFFKQWGGVDKKKAGRLLLGKTWDELPVATSAP